MARKRVPPEAQIIALFSGLSIESRQMVMFGLNAMMLTGELLSAPKSTAPAAPGAGKKSSRRNGAGSLTQNTEGEMVNVSAVGVSGD